MMSVTKALPLVKKRPARAGRKAKARGELCQCDRSSGAVESSWSRPRDGRIKSPAECRVSSKLEKESKDERRRESDGSMGAPSAAGKVVFADGRLRSVKEGGRGTADDDALARGVCEASSGDGGADVLDGDLIMVPVMKDWERRAQGSWYGIRSRHPELQYMAVACPLVVHSSQLLVAFFGFDPPLRLASAGTPGRSFSGPDQMRASPGVLVAPTCSSPAITLYACLVLYLLDSAL